MVYRCIPYPLSRSMTTMKHSTKLEKIRESNYSCSPSPTWARSIGASPVCLEAPRLTVIFAQLCCVHYGYICPVFLYLSYVVTFYTLLLSIVFTVGVFYLYTYLYSNVVSCIYSSFSVAPFVSSSLNTSLSHSFHPYIGTATDWTGRRIFFLAHRVGRLPLRGLSVVVLIPCLTICVAPPLKYGGLSRPCTHPLHHPSVFASCLRIFGPLPSHPFPTLPLQVYPHDYCYCLYTPYVVHRPCRPSSILVRYVPRPSSVGSLYVLHAQRYSFIKSFDHPVLCCLSYYRQLIHPFPRLLYHDLH